MSLLELDCFEGVDFDKLKEMLQIFDLIIVEQVDRGQPEGRARIIEALMLGSGPPVIVVPYIHKEPASLRNILVAWDGSAAGREGALRRLAASRQGRTGRNS
jgi:hypothetical protein